MEDEEHYGYFIVNIGGNDYLFENDYDLNNENNIYFYSDDDMPPFHSENILGNIHFYINIGDNRGFGYFQDGGTNMSYDVPAVPATEDFTVTFVKWKPNRDSNDGEIVF